MMGDGGWGMCLRDDVMLLDSAVRLLPLVVSRFWGGRLGGEELEQLGDCWR